MSADQNPTTLESLPPHMARLTAENEKLRRAITAVLATAEQDGDVMSVVLQPEFISTLRGLVA